MYLMINYNCRTPWKFASLSLPTKLPPPVRPVAVSSLPIVGYLEQTVASVLNRALTAVGKQRPKHPNRSSEQSASEYLALYLKGTMK